MRITTETKKLQSFQTSGTARTLNSLTFDLVNFGLNPFDWKLESLGNHQYRISNFEDPSFQFFGVTDETTQSSRWQDLRLISL